jgi:hypothetical protein
MRLLLRLGPFALLFAVAAGLAASWADLSPRSVGMPLLTGLVAIAWIGLLRRFVLANSSPAPEPSRARRLVETITTGAQWFLALLFGLAAVPQEKGPGLALVGVGLGLLFLPVALIVTYSGKAPPAGPPVRPPPEGWLFVPRTNGAGLAIAPGHPRTWQAVALFAAGLLALVAFSLAL